MLESKKKFPPNTVTFNLVMAAYAKSSLRDAGEKAAAVLERMNSLSDAGILKDVKADRVSYNTLMNAYAKSGIQSPKGTSSGILGAERERMQHPLRHLAVDVGPQQQHAVFQRQLAIANQGRGIRPRLGAQTFAHFAPTQVAVEGETVGRERFETATARFANAMLAVRLDPPIRLLHLVTDVGDVQHAVADREGRFDTFGNPAARLGVAP